MNNDNKQFKKKWNEKYSMAKVIYKEKKIDIEIQEKVKAKKRANQKK